MELGGALRNTEKLEFHKTFEIDVHKNAIFSINIVEGCERPAEWKEVLHEFPRWP